MATLLRYNSDTGNYIYEIYHQVIASTLKDKDMTYPSLDDFDHMFLLEIF